MITAYVDGTARTHRRPTGTRRRRFSALSAVVAVLAAMLTGALQLTGQGHAAAGTVTATTPPALPAPLPVPGQPIVAAGTSGYLPDSWQISPDGSFGYRLPLEVPAGRAGMRPHLASACRSPTGTR